MTAFGPTAGGFYDLQSGGVIRLGGQLVATKAIVNGNTYRERLMLGGRAASVDVRVKMAVSGGTPTMQGVPRTAALDADCTSGLSTATNLSNNSEANHSYTTKGEGTVDVVLDATGAAARGSGRD